MQNEDLPETIVSEIRYLKLRLIYEAGREEEVENFCKVTGVIDALDFIGNSKARYIRYARYMEALVAYHKFYNSEKD
jgi:CRISPR-associated protein Csm2